MLLAGLPAPSEEKRGAIKREVTLVFDRSGSMSARFAESTRFELEMSDFGIEPPRVFLMKTADEVDVFFDIALVPVETRWVPAESFELRVSETVEPS